MPRHPIQFLTGDRTHAPKVAVEYINFIVSHITPKAMTLTEIREATLKDPIQDVSAHIRDSTWHKTEQTQQSLHTKTL